MSRRDDIIARRAAQRASRNNSGCLLTLLTLPWLLLARHREPEPAGEPLGTRRHDPRHAAGGWQTDRDIPPEHQGGGPRPPLADNLDRDCGGGTVNGLYVAITLVAIVAFLGCAIGAW